jgi:hypothetical protein
VGSHLLQGQFQNTTFYLQLKGPISYSELLYTWPERVEKDKHFSLVHPGVSYKDNKVLWLQY